jgi:hypothetical protein
MFEFQRSGIEPEDFLHKLDNFHQSSLNTR